jgi:hypothetical protein
MSKSFRFLVGPEKREFTIHAALVAHQSTALRAMVYNGCKESILDTVEWDDIDERTFVSFWQFVYTGDYDSPGSTTARPLYGDGSLTSGDKQVEECQVEENAEDEAPVSAEVSVEKEDFDNWETRPRRKKKPTKRERLWNDFKRSWVQEPPAKSVEGSQGDMGMEGGGNRLILHASVYILGERYGIERLMVVALNRLHQALVDVDLSGAGSDDMAGLLRYCYENSAPGKLGELLVHYTTCHVEKLWKNAGFLAVLDDFPTLSKALIGSMLPRLS